MHDIVLEAVCIYVCSHSCFLKDVIANAIFYFEKEVLNFINLLSGYFVARFISSVSFLNSYHVSHSQDGFIGLAYIN